MQIVISACIHAHFVGDLRDKIPPPNLVASNNVSSQPHSTAICFSRTSSADPTGSSPEWGFFACKHVSFIARLVCSIIYELHRYSSNEYA